MAVPTLTANSPVAGSIAWSAFTIQYGGVAYGVAASSTALKYTWWVYNGGSPILTASNTMPTNLTADDIVLFVNKGGIPINVPASSVVDGSLIVDGTIVGSALIVGTVAADRMVANSIGAAQIAADAITTDELAANSVTALEIVAGAVTTPKLAADAVVAGKVAADAIGAREIIADSITAAELQAGAVTADRLAATAIDGKTVTGAIIRTAGPTLPRIQIDNGGITQWESVGGVLVPTTSIGSGQNKFTGSVTAEDIMVQDGLELYGQNNAFGSNSKVTLRSGQGAPTGPPSAMTTYQNQAISTPLTTAYRQLYGHLIDSATEYGVGEFYGDSRLYKGSTYYELTNFTVTKANGQVVKRIVPRDYTRVEVGGVQYAAVMGEIWDAGSTAEYPYIGTIWYNDNSMNSTGTVAPTEAAVYFWSDFSWFKSEATGRFIASTFFGASAKSMQVHGTQNYLAGNVDTISVHRIEFINGSVSNANIAYRGGYTLQFASHRVHADERLIGVTEGHTGNLGMTAGLNQIVWVLHTTHQNLVLTENMTTRLTNEEWPAIPGQNHRVNAHGSITNNSLTFFAHLSSGANDTAVKQSLTKYNSWHWSGASVPLWLKFAWRGHSTKTTPEFLTAASPVLNFAPVKRAWATVSVPAIPPPEAGQNGARDINKDVYGWTIYGARAATEPANAGMFRQTTPAGNPVTVQSYEIGAAPTTGTAVPVLATQGFPSLSPSKIVSSAGDGNGPFLSLDGDGNVKGKTFNSQVLEDTGWLPLPFVAQGGWADYDATTYGPCMYRRKNGIVYLSGLAKTIVANYFHLTMAYMPVGFRPRVDQLIRLPSSTAAGAETMYLQKDGRMYFPGAPTSSTSGTFASIVTSFPADA